MDWLTQRPAVGLAAVVLLGSCAGCTSAPGAAGPVPSAPPRLVAGMLLPDGPPTDVRGTVGVTDDCVVLDPDGTTALVVWPYGSTLTADAAAVDVGNGSVSIGDGLDRSRGWRMSTDDFVAWLDAQTLDEPILSGFDECADVAPAVVVMSRVESFDSAE